MAGYSKRSLTDKLGIKPGFSIAILNEPPNYLPEVERSDLSSASLDLIQMFTTGREELKSELPRLKERIKQNGMIWISWPKKSSKVITDLDENIVRDIALANGLVDVKVIAVDEIWSGLKLVIRLKDRK